MVVSVLTWLTDFLTGAILESRKAAKPKGHCQLLLIQPLFSHQGEEVLPSNRLKGMCCWKGLHFHSWINYDGVTFSLELSKCNRTFLGFGGSENWGRYGFKNQEEGKFKKTDFSFSLFGSFYCIACSKASIMKCIMSTSRFQRLKKNGWRITLLSGGQEGMGYFRWKKSGDQIWNEEQHSRVEFILVINLIGQLEFFQKYA